jgi:hypothetical protein
MQTKNDDAEESLESKDWVQTLASKYGKAGAYALGTAALFFVIWAVVVYLLTRCPT